MSTANGSASAISLEPKPGTVYLLEEKRPKATYEWLDQTVSAGYNGLVVTRDFPKKLLAENELASCRILWLTNLVGEGRINPTAIGILMGQLRTFIEGQKRTTIVLDGLEYLVSLNTYDRMLQFMHQLKDLVVTNDCIMFVPVDPRTMNQRELALLERCMEPVLPKTEVEAQEDNLVGAGDEGVLRLLDVRPR